MTDGQIKRISFKIGQVASKDEQRWDLPQTPLLVTPL